MAIRFECIHIYIYIYIYIYYMCVCAYDVSTYVHAYMCVRTNACLHACMYAGMNVCIHTSKCINSWRERKDSKTRYVNEVSVVHSMQPMDTQKLSFQRSDERTGYVPTPQHTELYRACSEPACSNVWRLRLQSYFKMSAVKTEWPVVCVCRFWQYAWQMLHVRVSFPTEAETSARPHEVTIGVLDPVFQPGCNYPGANDSQCRLSSFSWLFSLLLHELSWKQPRDLPLHIALAARYSVPPQVDSFRHYLPKPLADPATKHKPAAHELI